jgi:hypothetical protein
MTNNSTVQLKAFSNGEGMVWLTVSIEALGLIPAFLNPHDEMDARTQLEQGYGFGWYDVDGKMKMNKDWQPVGKAQLLYPDDPPMNEIGRTQLRDETIIVFPYGFVAVVQPDGSFRATRMD